MYTLRLIFCACYFIYAEGTVPGQDQRWRNWKGAVEAIPKPSRDNLMEKIGEGVKLRARVLYDSNFVSSSNKNVSASTRTAEIKPEGTESDNLETYFRALFKEVQQYFSNRSIMINISVENVTQNNDLVAYYSNTKKIINARETLNNVTKYGETQEAPNNTVFYLFTWPPNEGNPKRLFDYIGNSTNNKLGVSEVATNGTFCSSDTSAAFIRHHYSDLNYWSTAKATLFLFGSPDFIILYQKDMRKMNETFSRCPRYNEDDKEATSTKIPVPPAC
ncbi:uncharacterized protein LOC142564633 [Dermacentor variabilis]|uniref:uncharacterized protein LOC142564633 n=1 Tax=Dermacentor variabilis TaxID=34621 RepID=UPI003F5C48BE